MSEDHGQSDATVSKDAVTSGLQFTTMKTARSRANTNIRRTLELTTGVLGETKRVFETAAKSFPQTIQVEPQQQAIRGVLKTDRNIVPGTACQNQQTKNHTLQH